METSKEISQEFVVCINNQNYQASLELHKIYQMIPDEGADSEAIFVLLTKVEKITYTPHLILCQSMFLM